MKTLLLAVHVSVLLLWLVSCARQPSVENGSLEPKPSPPLSWSTDAHGRILLATFCCDGPMVQDLVRPYIPEAQIWGDGRYFWSVHDSTGARQVFVKQLSTSEMTGLLQEIASSGFFAWDEQYEAEPVVDAASQCLTVILADQERTVCVTHGGAPEAFYELFGWLTRGAGTPGDLFWPRKAYLTGFRLESTDVQQPQADVAWPATLAHVPISEAIAGIWLDDEASLRVIWDATNRDLYHMPVLKDRDGSYRLILQVPGVSWLEP